MNAIWVKSLVVMLAAQVLTNLHPSVAGAQGPIASGETLTGTISPVADSDTWTFSANIDDAIVIRVGEITQSGSFTPRISLRSPSMAVLATAFGSVTAEIAVTAASSGTFTVTVDDAGTTATGTYRLTLAKTGSAVVVSPSDEGGPLTNGAMQTGTIDVGDLDVWTITATAGQAIVVRMGETSASLSPWLRIYSPSGGAALGSSFGSAAAEVAVTATTDGTFLVVAGDNSSGLAGSGAYRLTLAKTGSAVVVSPSDEGGPLTARLSSAIIDVGDLDVWTLAANHGDNIVVTMEEVTSGSALSPWLRIYSPSGALLGTNFGTARAQVAVTAMNTGTYLVVAGDNSSGLAGSGAYWLTPSATVDVPGVVTDGRPIAWALSPVAPNPLRGAGRVTLDVPRRAQVRLVLLDLAGREVNVLSHGELEPGRFSVPLDVRSQAPGVFFLRLESAGMSLQRAMVLIR